MKVERQIISTPDAPAAIGPYSQAVLVGDTLYCAGQVAIHPESGELLMGSISEQTERVLNNLGAVLQTAGMSFRNVVRCTVYLTDMNDFAEMNAIYGRYFPEEPPARATVQVAGLPRNVNVEISCTAVR